MSFAGNVVESERLDNQSSPSTGANASFGASGISSANSVSHERMAISLPRGGPGRSSCIRDSQCRGPKHVQPPVDGRCQNGRCVCPLPWSGWSCNRRIQCLWHEPSTGAWSDSSDHCELSTALTDSNYIVCECPIWGTYDVLAVEQSQTPLRAPPFVAFNSFHWDDVEYLKWENLKRAWIAVVLLASIDAVTRRLSSHPGPYQTIASNHRTNSLAWPVCGRRISS